MQFKSNLHAAKAFGYTPKIELKDLDKYSIDTTDESLEDVFANRLCGHPDYEDEEVADTPKDQLSQAFGIPEEDAECIGSCHRRMKAARATGSGSWPSGCHPDIYPNNHCVRYYVLRDTFPQQYKRAVTDEELGSLNPAVWRMTKEQIFDLWAGKPLMEVALQLSDESFRRVGCAHIETDDRSKAQLVIRSRYISGSTIGIGWFNDGTCRDQVEYHIDNSWRSDLHRVTGLFTHECGHTNDLQHQFSNQGYHHSIMSYSQTYPFEGFSTGQSPYRKPRDASMSILQRQYGDEEVPKLPTDPIKPPPPKPEGDFSPAGVLAVKGEAITLYVKKNA